MAANKKSFVMYSDILHTVQKLPKDVAGELFLHILEYVNDMNPTTDNLLVEVAFEPIKQQLKRDLQRYESICERNRNNGKKGGRPTEPKKPTGLFGNPTKPKKADNDNDNDNDNESDNDNDINLKRLNNCLLSEVKTSDVPNDLIKYFQIAQSWQSLFEENARKLGVKWTNLQNTKFKKAVTSIRLLIENDGRTIEELRIVYEFLKKDQFWMQNVRSHDKLREKFDNLITHAKNPKQNGTFTQQTITDKREQAIDQWRSAQNNYHSEAYSGGYEEEQPFVPVD